VRGTWTYHGAEVEEWSDRDLLGPVRNRLYVGVAIEL
jgi:hypothetical protein